MIGSWKEAHNSIHCVSGTYHNSYFSMGNNRFHELDKKKDEKKASESRRKSNINRYLVGLRQ